SQVQLGKDDLERLSKEELLAKWQEQNTYLDYLERKAGSSAADNRELALLRESEEKLKQQQLEANRRENVLVMRLTTKEQEMQECAHQIQELKGGGAAGGWTRQLRAALLDPAVNVLFERMKREVDSMRSRLQETQNELSAWKFTPDSNTGKRLMAKCRLLYQENEELGKMISSGRLAKLEGDLALQRNFSEEMKKSQTEQDEFLLELDEEVEGMQSTIYLLQQQLREAKEQLARLQADKRLTNGDSVPAAKEADALPNGHVAEDEDRPLQETRTRDAGDASAAAKAKRGATRTARTPARRSAAPRTRKRAREQSSDSPEAKIAALEIDADTEVQVAQTLACWSLVNKERQQDGSSDSLAADDTQDL
ncbi:unnamed protein product, partial [Ixodes hexagonus]